MHTFLLVASVVLCLLLPVASGASTIFVGPTNSPNPGNGGTSQTPLTNLTAAWERATQQLNNSDVDIVFLPGRYVFSSSWSLAPQYNGFVLTLKGFSATDVPVITCTDRSFNLFYVYQYVSGAGFTAQDLKIEACYTAIYADVPGPVLLQNLDISGMLSIAVVTYTTQQLQIIDSTLTAADNDYLVSLYNGGSFVMLNCVLDGGRLDITSSTGNHYVNNTMITNSQQGCIYIDDGFLHVEKSVLVFSQQGIYADDSSEEGINRGFGFPTVTVSNNTLFFGNGAVAICTGQGTVDLYSVPVSLCDLTLSCQFPASVDRCFTCGGSDACLGCDGIPYSGQTNCSDRFLPAPSGSFPVSFGAASVSAQLYATTPSGVIANPTFDLEVILISVTEVRPDGSIAKQYLFDDLVFYLSALGFIQTQGINASQAIYEYYFTTIPARIKLTYMYFSGALNLTAGGIPFFIAEDTLKLTLEVNDWPFEQNITTVNSLELKIKTRTKEQILGASSVIDILQGPFTIQRKRVDTDNTICKYSFLNFAWFQRNASNVNASGIEQITVFESTNESDAFNNVFVFRFPGYFSSLVYDPDFSVTLDTNTDNGDGDTDIGLIVGLTVSLPIAFLFVLVVIVVGSAVLYWKRQALRNKITATSRASSGTL